MNVTYELTYTVTTPRAISTWHKLFFGEDAIDIEMQVEDFIKDKGAGREAVSLTKVA